MTTLKATWMGGAALWVLATAIQPAAAQTDTAADQEDMETATAAPRQIEEITVTARKVEEGIQDVPVAVTAFTEAELEKRNIQDITELSRLTPGFLFDSPFGRQFDRPIIRGQASILGASGVSIFIDGVNVPQSIQSLNFGDIQSIEIIKGPQSALFGRNTYSGAINITTKQPTNDYNGDVQLEAGSYGLYRVLGSARGPIIDDRLFFSVAGRYYTFDSEFDDDDNLNPSVGNEESLTFSGSLTARPLDRWEVTMRASYNKDDDGMFPIGLLGFEDLNVNVPGGAQLGGVQPFYQGVVPPQPANPSGSSQLSDTLGAGGGLEREEVFFALNSDVELFDGYNFVSTFGYTREHFKDELDSDGQPEAFSAARIFGPFPIGPMGQPPFGVGILPFDFTTVNDDEQETIVLEARIDSPQQNRWRWRLGGYYFNNEIENDSLLERFEQPRFEEAVLADVDSALAQIAAALGQPFVVNLAGPPMFGPLDPSTTEIRNVAVYGSLAYDITSNLSATVELRWARETIEETTFDRETGEVAVDGGTGIALDFEEDFDALTPRFILDYQVRPDNKLYAIAARGTKPGGFNGALAFELGIGSFEEETLWQFELGSKNLFFDRQVLVNLAGYFSLLDGYQLTENLAALGATTTQGSAVSNLGEVEIFGLELDTSFTPNAVPGLTLRGNYAFTDAEFTEGTEETQQAVFGEGSLEGQELPRQARHQAAFFIDYEKPFTEDLSGFFSVNGSYLSSRFAQVQNLAETGDSFELAARATLFWRDRYSLTVYGENLNDEDAVLGVLRFIDPHGTGSFTVAGNVIENAFNLASDGQSRGFQVNNRDGRRWGVILRYQF